MGSKSPKIGNGNQIKHSHHRTGREVEPVRQTACQHQNDGQQRGDDQFTAHSDKEFPVVIGDFSTGGKADEFLFQRHSADGTGTGPGFFDLRIHRTDINDFGAGGRGCFGSGRGTGRGS